MKKFVTLTLVLAVGIQIGRLLESRTKLALAGSDHGGGAENCAAQNGDVNADGTVNVSDAVTILGFLFQGSPRAIVSLCAAPPAPLGLPDTGQNVCYGFRTRVGWADVPCDEALCRGQDAHYTTGCPPENRFTDNSDGTVTDHCTGLMWQKATAETNGDGQTPDDESDAVLWCDALAYCENLSFAGHDDWRLPNVRELQSVVDYGSVGASIDPTFGAFSAGDAGYWSSTSDVNDPGRAWLVRFGGGSVDTAFKNSPIYVRAVRNAP